MSAHEPALTSPDPNPASGAGQEASGGGVAGAILIRRLLLLLALAGVLALAAWPAVEAVADWRLPDNDDAMRVAQVRDWLAGQSWWDVRQHRFAPLDGGDLHWSRLADLPLAALAVPLGAVLGPQAGLKAAAFLAPPLLGALAIALVALTARRLAPPGDAARTATVAGVSLALLAFPAMTWFAPGRVDHHGLQLVLLLGALAGLAGGSVRGAALAGLLVAASLLVGLETAPVLVVLTGAVAAGWLVRGHEVRGRTIAFCAGLGGGLLVLLALTVPPHAWARRSHDAFSLIHLVPAVTGATGLALAALVLRGPHPAPRLIGAGVIGGAVIAAALPFPELLLAPYDRLDPLLARLWLSRVGEAVPGLAALSTGQAGLAVAFAVPPLLATAAALLVLRAPGRAVSGAAPGPSGAPGPPAGDAGGRRRLDGMVLVFAILVLTCVLSWVWQLRVAGQAAAVGAIAVAVLAGIALERHGSRGLVRVILLASPILPGAAGTALSHLQPDPGPPAAVQTGPAPSAATDAASPASASGHCTGERALSGLAGLPPTLAITTIDAGAPLILATPHRALAAPYHRNNRSLAAAYRFFLASPPEARSLAQQLGAGLVVTCAGAVEAEVLAAEAPDGLMAALVAGRTPDWLVALPAPPGSDIRAWRVVAVPGR